MYKNLVLTLIGLLFIGVMGGCATPLHKAVNQVEPGMDKADVIDLLGPPRRTSRAQGKDHWTYTYYQNEIEQGTVISFLNSKVVGSRPARLSLSQQEKAEDFPEYEEYTRYIKKEKAKKLLKQKPKSDGNFVEIK